MKRRVKKSDLVRIPQVVDEPDGDQRFMPDVKQKGALWDAFQKWQSGTPLASLLKETGLKKGKLRRTFIKMAGGKEQFTQVRKSGAGAREQFGGKRDRSSQIAAKDTNVKEIESAKRTDGWTHRLEWHPERYVFIDPEGAEYVRAEGHERADLIYRMPPGFPNVRLRRLETAASTRKAKRVAKELKRGQEALKRQRSAKRAKRKIRRKK